MKYQKIIITFHASLIFLVGLEHYIFIKFPTSYIPLILFFIWLIYLRLRKTSYTLFTFLSNIIILIIVNDRHIKFV